MAAVIWVHSI